MQSILNRIKALSVFRPSANPTTTDSSRIEPSLFDENSPSTDDSSQRSGLPRVTNVVVKHSSAFNSNRTVGMSKLQQQQFTEAMKGMIIDHARVLHPEAQVVKVIMSRKEKTCPASPNGICDTTVHVARLLRGSRRGDVVVAESEECDYLADDVENLWEKTLEKVGAVLAERL